MTTATAVSAAPWWAKAATTLDDYAAADQQLAELSRARAAGADLELVRTTLQHIAAIAQRRADAYTRIAAELRRRHEPQVAP